MKTFIFFVVLAIPFYSEARLGKAEEFPFVLQFDRTGIMINDDGSYTETEITEFKVQNEEETKKIFSPFKIDYDPLTENVEIEEAYVQNGKEKIFINKENIQKSSAASKSNGLISNSELAIPFSQIKQGTIIALKKTTKYKAGAFGKYFSYEDKIGNQVPEMSRVLFIESPKELFYKINDPQHVLTVNQSKLPNGHHLFELKLVKPVVNVAVEEIATLKDSEQTSVVVSNVETWDKLKQLINYKFSSVQEKGNLPPALLEVVNAIPKNANFETKVETLLTYITSHFDYIGDWRGTGKMIPKPIDKIAADHFGDCKDFSTLLLKMLRELKVKADYAVIERSYRSSELSEKSFPSFKYFNHVIVRAENDGKVYWIDPTNRYSVGLNVREDIKGKMALSLGESTKILERVEETKSSSNESFVLKKYDFDSVNSASVEAFLSLKGEFSKIVHDSLAGEKKEKYKDVLMLSVAGNEKNIVTNFDYKNSTDGKYHDIAAKVSYKSNELSKEDKDKKGNFLVLPGIEYLKTLLYLRDGGVGTLDLGFKNKIKHEFYYKNVYLTGDFPTTCEIKDDGIEASRKIETLADGFSVKDEVVLKKSIFNPDDYSGDEFSFVARRLYNCFNNETVKIVYGSKRHTDNISLFEEKIAKLPLEKRLEARREKAMKAIDSVSGIKEEDNLSPVDGRVLLEKNLKESPQDSLTYVYLGHFYRSNSYIVGDTFYKAELKNGLISMETALKYDHTNVDAIFGKARIMRNLHLRDEASNFLNEFLKTADQSKFTPKNYKSVASLLLLFRDQKQANIYFDRAIHSNLSNEEKAALYADRGSLNMTIKNYEGCVEDYEHSLSLDSSSAWHFGNVSWCYIELKKYDRAIERAKKAISIMNYGIAHRNLADAYLGKGDEFYINKDYKNAEDYYQKAILESPSSKAYLTLANLYVFNGKRDQVKDLLTKAEQLVDDYNPLDWVTENIHAITQRLEAMDRAMANYRNADPKDLKKGRAPAQVNDKK